MVNAYYTNTSYSGKDGGTGPLGLGNGKANSSNNITTGLLPNYLSVSGKTRQNDLDVGFTISINPGSSTTRSLVQGEGSGQGGQENRQAFLTFGDASWGSIKIGRDLGIYASDAILNDMTLLGVGAGAGNLAGNTTTLGRIGTGFMYADWKSQVAYTSPNFNGFNFTVGVTQSWNAQSAFDGASSTKRGGGSPAFEGKASYDWTGDVAGKVWASAISQRVDGLTNAVNTVGANLGGATPAAVAGVVGSPNTINGAERVHAWDLGTTVNLAGLGLTAYYGQGDGIGQTGQLVGGFDSAGKTRDSDQWYLQAVYALPTATKVGVSYGQSTLDGNSIDTFKDVEDSMWTIGAYHPITKHLNLVAEYSQVERDVSNRAAANVKAEARTISLGAILFF